MHRAQIHVFSQPEAVKAATAPVARGRGAGGGMGSGSALGDADYHVVLEYKMGGPLTYVTASTHTKACAPHATRTGARWPGPDGRGDMAVAAPWRARAMHGVQQRVQCGRVSSVE